jgi:hypothetical protein
MLVRRASPTPARVVLAAHARLFAVTYPVEYWTVERSYSCNAGFNVEGWR